MEVSIKTTGKQQFSAPVTVCIRSGSKDILNIAVPDSSSEVNRVTIRVDSSALNTGSDSDNVDVSDVNTATDDDPQLYCFLLSKERSDDLETPKTRRGKSAFTEDHKLYLKQLLSEDFSCSLGSLIDRLQHKYDDFKVSRKSLAGYLADICNFNIERELPPPTGASVEDIINKRYQWASEYNTRLDFSHNCIFVDLGIFNGCKPRSQRNWLDSDKAPPTRRNKNNNKNTNTYTTVFNSARIFGAICSQGCIDMKIITPMSAFAEHRKSCSSDEAKSPDTIMYLFFYEFMEHLLQQISANEQYKQLKYIVLDECVVEPCGELIELIEAKGLQIVYLPPDSGKMSPTEGFWSDLKNGILRAHLDTDVQFPSSVEIATLEIPQNRYIEYCSDASEYKQFCIDRVEF